MNYKVINNSYQHRQKVNKASYYRVLKFKKGVLTSEYVKT